jgi:hypothetical protein
MKLSGLAEARSLEEITPPSGANAAAEIVQGYASDLLSDVLAHAPAGGLLVTLQVHLNVIAVASHADLRAVVFASGRRPEDEILARAVEEGITLYVAAEDTFEVVGRLYELGVKGRSA